MPGQPALEARAPAQRVIDAEADQRDPVAIALGKLAVGKTPLQPEACPDAQLSGDLDDEPVLTLRGAPDRIQRVLLAKDEVLAFLAEAS